MDGTIRLPSGCNQKSKKGSPVKTEHSKQNEVIVSFENTSSNEIVTFLIGVFIIYVFEVGMCVGLRSNILKLQIGR